MSETQIKLCTPQIVRPSAEMGVDWSSERIVLVAIGNRELWWRKGCSYYGGRMSGTRYAAASLVLVNWDKKTISRGMPARSTLQDGGRLSKSLIEKHAAVIDEFFGVPVSHLISTRGTVVDDGNEPCLTVATR